MLGRWHAAHTVHLRVELDEPIPRRRSGADLGQVLKVGVIQHDDLRLSESVRVSGNICDGRVVVVVVCELPSECKSDVWRMLPTMGPSVPMYLHHHGRHTH
jgi:hypothetical protein